MTNKRTPEQETNLVIWLDALRSGAFEQGHGALQRDGKFCCLGVACEITGERGERDAAGDVRYFGAAYYGLPPLDFLSDTFGLPDYIAVDLAIKNDDDGYSFHEIADFIEANYF